MLNTFTQNINDNFSINGSDKILLAVSGGADSVVMLDLFARSKFSCGIAHCNFKLRGEDSDLDEQFVEKLAEKYKFQLHKISFDTQKYAQENGISIEMAARDLRYEWFEKIRQEFGYQYIALAHHKDDVIETFFINLVRGTGIRGLSGIKSKNGNIIRPLLFANQQDIINYTETQKLQFREDISNQDTKIIRNKLRHEILPLLTEINPAANNNILNTIGNLYASQLLMSQKIEEYRKLLTRVKKRSIIINISNVQQLELGEIVLYELLRDYNFNASQANDIYKAMNGESGRVFLSKTHQLVKDRNNLIINKIRNNEFTALIDENQMELKLPNSNFLTIESRLVDKNYNIPKQNHHIALDYNKLKFPLKIRTWRNGDFFYPLGMRQKKKLSDFFINEKYSIIDKQNALLLLSGDDIVWIIGKRIDNRYKITNKTRKVLELVLHDKS